MKSNNIDFKYNPLKNNFSDSESDIDLELGNIKPKMKCKLHCISDHKYKKDIRWMKLKIKLQEETILRIENRYLAAKEMAGKYKIKYHIENSNIRKIVCIAIFLMLFQIIIMVTGFVLTPIVILKY